MTVSAMKKWMIVPVMGAVWLLALLYPSGIGNVYHIYDRSKLLVVALVMIHLLACGWLRRVPRKEFLLLVYILVATLFTSFFFGHDMLDYIWLYGITYLISLLPVYDGPMRIVSLLYGFLGMAVLFICNYGSAFSGWNTNSLAMIAFFSFSLFIVSFNRAMRLSVTLALVGYALLYFLWTESLNSRSGVLFALAMILGIYKILPFHRWMKKRSALLIVLLLPLVIAVIVVLIRNMPWVDSLNTWSLTTFRKPIFNGRDQLWYQGFERWLSNPIIGNGNLSAANWHNSAVTMLVGGGTVGYALWIGVNRHILSRGSSYLDDHIVFGLMLAFLCIWLQQTVELGLVAGQANAIPYGILGLLMGRVRTLEREHEDQTINYCTSLQRRRIFGSVY